MSTISKKNPQILAQSFVYNFKQFESYVKHCINILKNYNWLKNNQFNNTISDYDYMTTFFNYTGILPYELIVLYNQYLKDFVSNLPATELSKLKTNQYYPSASSLYKQVFSGINKNNNNHSLNSSLNNNISELAQLSYVVIVNDFSVDKNREYNKEEILNLIKEGKILIVQTETETVFIDNNLLLSRCENNEIEFIDKDLSGGFIFESNTGDIMEFFETANEQEKQIWFFKNYLFIDYIRKNYLSFNSSSHIDFGIKLEKSFNQTYEHLNFILKETKRQLKKKNIKNINQFSALIKLIEQDMEVQKINFENLPNTISVENFQELNS